jgi:hypothetical protein
MSAYQIAKKHFDAALAEAEAEKAGADVVARHMLHLVIETWLKTRTLKDVQAELISAADNADPDTDYMFMRP